MPPYPRPNLAPNARPPPGRARPFPKDDALPHARHPGGYAGARSASPPPATAGYFDLTRTDGL